MTGWDYFNSMLRQPITVNNKLNKSAEDVLFIHMHNNKYNDLLNIGVFCCASLIYIKVNLSHTLSWLIEFVVFWKVQKRFQWNKQDANVALGAIQPCSQVACTSPSLNSPRQSVTTNNSVGFKLISEQMNRFMLLDKSIGCTQSFYINGDIWISLVHQVTLHKRNLKERVRGKRTERLALEV